MFFFLGSLGTFYIFAKKKYVKSNKMSKKEVKKQNLKDLEKKAVKKNLLSFVLGGESETSRCSVQGSKYADSIYVHKPKPIIVVKLED